MAVALEHRLRIKQELREAGTTAYGLLKNESRYLPELIHHDEHIEAVAYGRYEKGGCLMAATDRRILFLDKKPLFTFADEIMYEVVSGIACSRQGYFTRISLHTRFSDTTIRYVNWRAAAKFVRYIEQRRIENTDDSGQARDYPETSASIVLKDKEIAFLAAHRLGTLSTTDRDGHVHGSVVNYYVESSRAVYIIMKPTSTKAHNIAVHPRVALTVYSETLLQTLQLHGIADVETDPLMKQHVSNILYQAGADSDLHDPRNLPALVVRIMPTDLVFSDHKNQYKYQLPDRFRTITGRVPAGTRSLPAHPYRPLHI